MCNVIILRIY